MSIRNELYREKMEEILDLSNGDVRDALDYLRSEFDLPKGYALTREKKVFEEIISMQTEDVAKNDRMKEFIEKLKG